jgi:RES domain
MGSDEREWESLEAARRVAPLACTVHRVVESQETVATLMLVDNRDEQQVLENLLEGSKPPLAADLRDLHYLLAAPFRYPPLVHGSRFGARYERGIFYGSTRLETALGECAFYRLLFLAGLSVPFTEDVITRHTAFSVELQTERGLDLRTAAFAAATPWLRSPVDYRATQAFGSAMRAHGVEAFLYLSARLEGADAVNVGVFTPRALGNRIENAAAWVCISHPSGIRWIDTLNRESLAFHAGLFLVEGKLPQPAF